MKHIKLLITLLIMGSCCAMVSCDQGLFSSCRRDDYSFIADHSLTIGIFDKTTNENILVIGQTRYSRDTVQLYNEKWEKARNGPVPGDGYMQLRFLMDEDKDVVGTLTRRRFYMYFNYQDIDTIDIAFTAMKNDCNEQVLESLKVSYNNFIYLDGPIEKYYVDFLK